MNQDFLRPTDIINHTHPTVAAQARALAAGLTDDAAIASACFLFVRDEIRHSVDYQMNPITCRASDVLAHGTGYCFAKSHLLAALLRANGIPAGLCYQRLSIDDIGPPFTLHGFNAVHLRDFGWYRLDPRGCKPGVTSAFTPPIETLAYAPKLPGGRLAGNLARSAAGSRECVDPSRHLGRVSGVAAGCRINHTWHARHRSKH